MSHTLTIRISSELAKWLEETAACTGISQGQLIREQIEKVKAESSNRVFMQLAGSISGPNPGGMICDL
jgi:hypothetical protein